jgi:hypothetical protein
VGEPTGASVAICGRRNGRRWPPFVWLATRGALGLNRSVAFGPLCTFSLTDYLLRSFDLAGSLNRTALGSAGCSRYQPFCQRRVSGLGAKLFQRDLPRLGRRLLSLDEIRLFKTSHRFSTLYFNLARAAVARRI